MICRGCGNRIPERYLRLDSFKCPFCGKLYKRIRTSKPVSAPKKGESLPVSRASGSSSQRVPAATKHKSPVAVFMLPLGIIFIIIGVVIGGIAPAILVPLGVGLICFGIVIAYFTSQKSDGKTEETVCHSHAIAHKAKLLISSVIVLAIILLAIGIVVMIRSKTLLNLPGTAANDGSMPTAATQFEIGNGNPFTLAADATFGIGKYQIKGNGSYEIEFSIDNMWDAEMMVFRFNTVTFPR